MKKLLRWLLLLACVAALTACPRDEDGYMRAKVNGKMEEFRVQPSAQHGGNDGRIEHVTFGAQLTEDVGKPALSFEIWNLGGNIVAGRPYVGDGLVLARYYYQRPRGTVIYRSRKEVGVFRITFSRIDDDRIIGTFSGSVARSASEGGGVIQLTDGSFSLPVHDG